MIDERMQEMASFHVLGILTENEAREFKKALQADPELRDFTAKLQDAAGMMAGAVPNVQPPAHLREKILAQVEAPENVVSLPPPVSRPMFGFSWAIAACFAILCLVLFVQDSHLRRTVDDQAKKISELDQLAQSLQSTTNDLHQTVAALRESNRLANLKIAMLNSLVADAPKTVAVTLWDSKQQDGVFVVQNLKNLPADKDYELWVIDEKQGPVAAGVFHVDENGNTRINFKPSQAVNAAGKFAVTIEAKGGVASPTIKNMVLASN